jgi:uncharacterized membrane protein YeiH
MNWLPNLATDAPLWLALLTVGVNAVVGALRGQSDPIRHWDIVGISVFALLMGLGGGFIRDLLIGNLPAESLRSPWFVVTVLAAIGLVVVVVGPHLAHVAPVMTLLNALALGLFAVSGTAYALRAGLPAVSAVLVGTAAAVGGGMLVSVMQNEVPDILLAGAPHALLAVLASAVYTATAIGDLRVAAVAAIAVAIAAQYLVDWLGLRTQPAKTPASVLLTRAPGRTSAGPVTPSHSEDRDDADPSS